MSNVMQERIDWMRQNINARVWTDPYDGRKIEALSLLADAELLASQIERKIDEAVAALDRDPAAPGESLRAEISVPQVT